MAEDLKSKLAAINAAKAERTKKQEAEAKNNAEIGEAQEAAGKENTLRDKAKALETKVMDAEAGAKEAEDAIQQAEGMLVEGGLEAEELAAIEGIKAEAQQKIVELQNTKAELATAKAEINQLNAEPANDAETQPEGEPEKKREEKMEPPTEQERQDFEKMDAEYNRLSQEKYALFEQMSTVRDEVEQRYKLEDAMGRLTAEQTALVEQIREKNEPLRIRKAEMVKQLKPSILPGKDSGLKQLLKVVNSPEMTKVIALDNQTDDLERKQQEILSNPKYQELHKRIRGYSV